jgi:hypothetical protein
MRSRYAIAIVSVAASGVAGCGGHAPTPLTSSTTTSVSSTTVAARPAAKPKPKPKPPPVLRLQLQLPLIGLSSAPTVRYATTAAKPTVRGVVFPASATVYMRAPDGTRIALNPRADGRFAVRTKLSPGTNSLQFTAARLGSETRNTQLAITWRGPGAAARQRAIYADPAKYLPAASAGINRKLKGVGKLPPVPVPAPSRHVTISFSLHTIKAPPPPPVGGDGKWLGGFELTEYYPALESWFTGRPVSAPGLSAPHRIDWLYSARGLSMEGDGIGLDGRQYHIANLGSGGWLTAGGANGAKFGVGADAPFWRTGGFWRSGTGQLTFPLANGNWSSGVGVRYVPPPAGISFAPGPSRPLSYLRSVAVDPRTIPEGSYIYIPAYAAVNGGWFEADDTGGAIVGRHIDIFRPPPANPANQGNFATGQRVYIVAPGQPLP